MIIDSVFQEFIKVVQENRNYTIGLVNEDGKVTACSDENLIGSVQNVDAPDSNNLFYRIRVKNVDYGWLWLLPMFLTALRPWNRDQVKMVSRRSQTEKKRSTFPTYDCQRRYPKSLF